MVGDVFPERLGTTGNPAAKNTEDNARDSDNHKNEQNRLGLVEIDELAHPSNHRREKLTDQGKQRGKNRSSALKSSSFHKNIYGNLSRSEQENQHRENSGENNEVTNLGDSKNAETILQRQNSHQLMRPQIAFLIHVTVVTKTRTTRRAETQACGLRT